MLSGRPRRIITHVVDRPLARLRAVLDLYVSALPYTSRAQGIVSAVNLFSMADPHNHDHQLCVSDGVNDAISADPNAVTIRLTRELFGAAWSRFVRQGSDSRDDPAAV
jgi:hypothetical protein